MGIPKQFQQHYANEQMMRRAGPYISRKFNNDAIIEALEDGKRVAHAVYGEPLRMLGLIKFRTTIKFVDTGDSPLKGIHDV